MSWLQDARNGGVPPTIVSTLRDPGELHLIAAHHKWDSNHEVLRRLAEHPNLDRGTGLLIFWLAEPPEATDHVDPDLSDLVDRLRDRLTQDDFASHSIAVDLRDDILGYNRLFIEKLRRAGIPPALWEPSPGEPFDEAAVVGRLKARPLGE